ncbi:MAG: HD domain-containing protein [Spirochaetes bacterium]|nr:HD domain-containing protein [Spirochaetota bacterium]
MFKKTKIDLTYIKPNSSFIRPLFSEEGHKILESRVELTQPVLDTIISKYGSIVYSIQTSEKVVIPHYRMKIAYNSSKEILDEIEKTDKLSKTGYKIAEKVIEDVLSDLYTIQIDEISLLKELMSFDEYLYNHSVNVGIMTAIFGKGLKMFSREELKSLTLGAYLIDIGQKKLDKQLLNKEGRYDVNELTKIRRHPQLGYELIKNINDKDAIVLQSILFHHEKFNNNGYYQLPYENLPIYPKLITVCDIYDALTTVRPFRKEALSAPNALRSVVNTSDLMVDRNIIKDFVRIMTPLLHEGESFIYPGDICELNSQELALVKSINPSDILNPVVLVFCKFERIKNNLKVIYYKHVTEIDLNSDVRYVNKILNNENQISMIKQALIDKKLMDEI